MTSRQDDKRVEAELAAMLGPRFPGMTVTVAHSERWNRKSVTFRWSGFAGLLPEERFHRLVSVLSEDFIETCMKGFVWLELAPGETVDAFLALPRSEDIAGREPSIYGELLKVGFFDSLRSALGKTPEKSCLGDFSKTQVLLSATVHTTDAIRTAKLLLIRHGAYCDCQTLLTAEPSLAQLNVSAA